MSLFGPMTNAEHVLFAKCIITQCAVDAAKQDAIKAVKTMFAVRSSASQREEALLTLLGTPMEIRRLDKTLKNEVEKFSNSGENACRA